MIVERRGPVQIAAGSGLRAYLRTVPSTPRISIAPDPNNDIGFINTSDKEVLDFEPPPRDAPESSLLYWRQMF